MSETLFGGELSIWVSRPWDVRVNVARQIGAMMAVENQSDPFIRNRVVSSLLSGTACPQDFGCTVAGNTAMRNGRSV